MPTRMIREGWLTSPKIALLTPEEECFFLRLLLCCDDYGRFEGDLDVLASATYPRDRSVSVKNRLAACVVAELVTLYRVDGKDYVEVPGFSQRLRAKKSKYPAPDDGMPVTCPTHARHVPVTCRPESEAEAEGESEVEEKQKQKTHDAAGAAEGVIACLSAFIDRYPAELPDLDDVHAYLVDKYGMTRKQAAGVMELPIEKLMAKLKEVEEGISKGTITNPGGYLLKIKQDDTPTIAPRVMQSQQEREKDREQRLQEESQKEKARRAEEQRVQAKLKADQAETEAYLKRDDLKAGYEEAVQGRGIVISSIFINEGWNSGIIQRDFLTWCRAPEVPR